MMQDVSVERAKKELKTIEIGHHNEDAPLIASGKNIESYSNFGPDMSGSEEDEASEIDSFILDENDIDESEPGMEASKFLLAAESEGQGIQSVDPQTQARLEALLEAAGISKLSSKDGKALSDPEVLRTLTSSVSSALDEAAQALHRMRDSQGQLMSADGMQVDANGESESIGQRSGSGNVADASEEGESLLSLACSAGYYELAQVLLAMKANVEDRGIKGDCTPLMEAASGGHVDIVRLLLLHNADINAQSSAGNTPLHYGACGGFTDVVRELVMNGANVEIHNENGHTPLMEAASAGHVEVAKILLEHGAGINTHSNEFKESALTLACYKGHLDMVKFLLEAGADQEHKTDEMHTALMEASMDGHVEVARLLLDSGAQVNMPADSFESPLTLAACGGHIELASLLIERGANIEEVNDEGYTPLMEAAREGHEDMVALLLSQGADINAQTEETQETALTLACCGGFLEVADFLLRSGAHIELGCSTPLMEAAQEGHLELVSFLLQAGANVEAQTGTGDTALTYACENGHTDVAEVLLECGAKLEHESEGGRTPLMKAARAGHLCTCQFLISKGADVNRATTSNDHTVLSLACAGGHLTVVELLLQHGADHTHKLKDGSTMVIEAAKGGHTQVVKLLLEWSSRYLAHSAADQLSQLNVADVPFEEPRVPVQGLANIVPPSEPDSQVPIPSAIQAKVSELGRQTVPKSLNKRLNGGGQVDVKGGNKFSSPDNFQHFFTDTGGLMNDRSTDKDEIMCGNQPSKEEQIQRKQQILEELKKVEQELQEKAHAQMLKQACNTFPPASQFSSANMVAGAAAAGLGAIPQTEQMTKQTDFSKLFKSSSNHGPGLIDPNTIDPSEFAKILTLSGGDGCAETSSPETCFQMVQAHLQQHQQQFLLQQHQQNPSLQLPVPLHPPVTTQVITAAAPGLSLAPEIRGGGGKIQGSKRNGANKQSRITKHLQPSQQSSPPPPPPPPPPLSVVSSAANPHLFPLPTQQQPQTIPLAQPIIYQTEHNGVFQPVEVSQILTSSSQVVMDPAQCQQLQLLAAQQVSSTQQQQQQQLLAYPQLIPQQEQQLLQQMFVQQNLQHQFHMQQSLQQVQCGQQLLQGVSSAQLTTVSHTNQVSPQIIQQQQQVKQQPPNPSSPGMPLNKPQPCKQRVAQLASQNTMQQQQQNVAAVNVDSGLGAVVNSLYSCVDVDSQTESNHDTALTLACAGGHAELVSLLITKDADIEHRDKKGFTPLILAATAGHVDVVEILLDNNADIEAQSERTKDTPLSLACSGGRYEVVELLLNRGANKEHRNVSDYTPLSLAASGGYVNIIRLLLSHNAEINSRTASKLGISPLMLAAMNGHTAAVKLLLDQGSDINAQIETNRNTALTLACFQGRHEVVSLLVDRKANIEHRAKTGLTPLMEAASGGYVEVGRVLLDKGADVNATPVPSSRDTALTIAADKGHYRFVELLLHRGAAVDVKNKKGNSPLWLACNGGHSDVVSLLVQAGADVDSQDNRKVSCLMAAFRRGHIKVVKWMVKKVTQFPSENEIKRYIATVTDKELQKKCSQCADVVVIAKDRQAAEANKNADNLLEQIKQEKEKAALKAELASKRRERRRERKKKGKQKNEKSDGDKDSGKNSSPEPDGESNNSKKDEDEEDDDEDDSNTEAPYIPAVVVEKSEAATKNTKVRNGHKAPEKRQSPPEGIQPLRLPATTPPVLPALTPDPEVSSGSRVSAARASQDARKRQQRIVHEKRREAIQQESKLKSMKEELCKKQMPQNIKEELCKKQMPQNIKEDLYKKQVPQSIKEELCKKPVPQSIKEELCKKPVPQNIKEELCKKQVPQIFEVTTTKVTSLMEPAVTLPAALSRPHVTTSAATSTNSKVSVSNVPKPSPRANNSHNLTSSSLTPAPLAGSSNNKDSLADVSINGGGSRANAKSKTSNIIKHSTTGIGDLDDFDLIPNSVFKSFDKINGTTRNMRKMNDSRKDWLDDYRHFQNNLPNMASRPANSSSSSRKGQKKEEGWKEVVRKNVSKKLIVPGSVISRLIGKGGCNITAIRELSGAHVEVEKSKGNADRTVTIKGCPEAIRQANNLINAMVEEPEKDVTELLTQVNKNQKIAAEEFPPQKAPVTITDFAIGTFTVPTTASSGSSSRSPVRSKSGKQGKSGSHSSNSANNVMGPTIGAWQNPIPGQVLPSSPRRSTQKQTAVSSLVNSRSTAPAAEKGSARQLMFGGSDRKRSVSPILNLQSSSASLSFIPTPTSANKGFICSTKPQDPRLQNQTKSSSMTLGSPVTSPVVRFSRPASTAAPRLEDLPLPIVTSGSSSHVERSLQARTGTPSSQSVPGEYNPFNSSLYFLTKKEEMADKKDFASVAAAGVVTTTPSPQTTSNPTPSTRDTLETVDPALQAKAPGFKIPHQGQQQQQQHPQYRLETGTSVGGYRLSPVGNPPSNPIQGFQNMNSGGVRSLAPVIPFVDDYRMSQILQLQQMRDTINPMFHPFLRIDVNAAGLAMPPGVYPQGMPGVSMPPSQQLQPQPQQKDEYSKPHRPMTLPEIKGGLNPNAPEFQLPCNGPLIMNEFDHQVGGGMVGMPLPDHAGRQSLGPGAVMEGSGHGANTNPASMHPVMHPDMFGPPGGPSIQHLLQQQQRLSDTVFMVAELGGSPPQSGPNRLTSNMGSVPGPNSSPPQSLTGPPGLSPGTTGGAPSFISQGQAQRVHTSMQNLAGGRPNSAPSVQPVDPALVGGSRSDSPVSTRTPPLDHMKFIQPIGGERRKGSGRPGQPAMTAGSYSNAWRFNDTAAYSQDWSSGASPVMRTASLPSAVITTSVVTGGGSLAYPGMPDAEEEVGEYGIQAQVRYSDPGMPSGDGDHIGIVQPPAMIVPAMFNNGPYPVAPVFPHKGLVGESQTPPRLWNPAMTLVPSDQGDSERWHSWNQ